MPVPSPTSGVGAAAYVQVTGTGITGVGAGTGSTNHPVAQYAVTLSLGSLNGNSNTVALTVVLKDVANTTVTQSAGTLAYKSYNYPLQGAPAWYKPSRGTEGPYVSSAPPNDNVASVSAGTITAQNIGLAVVEVQYSTFLNTNGTDANTGNPKDMIYAQILVTVTA